MNFSRWSPPRADADLVLAFKEAASVVDVGRRGLGAAKLTSDSSGPPVLVSWVVRATVVQHWYWIKYKPRS